MVHRGFWHELKRRHVYRVAMAYAVVGWLLIQVATQVFPIFHFPGWVDQAVVLLILIGFPIALVLAWAFDATPQGIVRTDASPVGDAANTPGQRRSHRAGIAVGVIGVLVAIVAGAAWWHMQRGRVVVAHSTQVTSAPPATPSSAMRVGAAAASPAATAPIPAKSIAVLPFENLSADKANAYFADGMQDLILTKLADIGDLKVISRTSTMQYGSHPQNLKTIGGQLGVAAILEGSVQKAGNQVLINVQLIDAQTDNHLWADSYTRTLDNIFGVEGEVAQKVADALNAKLTTAETAAVAKVPTENAAAYDAYLRGLVIEKKAPSSGEGAMPSGDSALRQAETLYAEAVKLDPQFALAWAHLAYIKVLIYSDFIDRSPAFLDEAKQAADKALQLQPNLGQGYLALAQYYYLGLRDLDAAVPPLQRARKLLPNNADVLVALSDVEERQGKWQEANAHLRQASLLEPRSADWLQDLAGNYAGMREFPQARAMLDRALVLDPDDPGLIMGEAYTWQEQGNLGEAQKLLDKVPASVNPGDAIFTRWQQFLDRRDYSGAITAMQSFVAKPGNSALRRTAGQSFLALALDMAGRKNEARALATQTIGELESQRKSPADDVELAYYLSQTYAVLGDKAAALREAQRNVEVHSTCSVCKPFAVAQLAQLQARFGDTEAAIAVLPYLLKVPNGNTVSDLRLDPGWDPLRKDPRFQALLKKYATHYPSAIPAAASTSASTGDARG